MGKTAADNTWGAERVGDRQKKGGGVGEERGEEGRGGVRPIERGEGNKGDGSEGKGSGDCDKSHADNYMSKWQFMTGQILKLRMKPKGRQNVKKLLEK